MVNPYACKMAKAAAVLTTLIGGCNPFSASGDPLLLATYYLLIILANSLDPDQTRQNVGPDLDSNCLTH